MINKERVELFAAELESGRHKQVCGLLRRTLGKEEDVGHCALGIAMLVAEREGVHIAHDDWLIGCLPPDVQNWYGFAEEDVLVKLEDGPASIPELNDNLADLAPGMFVPERHNNFRDIAQAVRATYLKDEGS